MNLRRWCAGMGALWFVAVPLLAGHVRQPIPRDATASISGRITVAGESPPVPVRRARVRLDGDAPDSGRFTDTDTDGRYRFDGLPAGAYRITADKPGYVTLPAGASRPFTRPPPIRLRPGEETVVDIALPRGAALEGLIGGVSGEPLTNMSVAAIRMVAAIDGRRPQTVAQTGTDDLGRYRLHSLPPGDYFIEAWLDSTLSLAIQRPGPGLGFARTYYPGHPQVTDGQSIRLAVGEERGGLDFALAVVPMTRLKVRVLDVAGRVPARASCRLQAVGGPVGVVRGFGDPRDSSLFTFPEVPPGDYWLLGAARSSQGEADEYAAVKLSASEGDLGEVVLRTAPGAWIQGTIDTDSGEPVPPLGGVSLVVHRRTFELPSADRTAGGRGATPDGRDGARLRRGRVRRRPRALDVPIAVSGAGPPRSGRPVRRQEASSRKLSGRRRSVHSWQ